MTKFFNVILTLSEAKGKDLITSVLDSSAFGLRMILMVLIFFIGFEIGVAYEREISEARLQKERLATARVRYQDWSAFTAHLRDDLEHPERTPLAVSGSHNLSLPIVAQAAPLPFPAAPALAPPPVLEKSKPGCN